MIPHTNKNADRLRKNILCNCGVTNCNVPVMIRYIIKITVTKSNPPTRSSSSVAIKMRMMNIAITTKYIAIKINWWIDGLAETNPKT